MYIYQLIHVPICLSVSASHSAFSQLTDSLSNCQYVYLSGCVYLYTVICIDVFSKLQQTFVRDIWGRTGKHYSDVTMGTVASQITSITIVCATIYSDADQRKHQSSASLAFVRGIQRSPVNSTHKGPATRKMFSFDDVDMLMLGCSQGFNCFFCI